MLTIESKINATVDQLAHLQIQSKQLEAEMSVHKDWLKDILASQKLTDWTTPADHSAHLAEVTQERLDAAKAKELLHPNTLRAITITSTHTRLTVK